MSVDYRIVNPDGRTARLRTPLLNEGGTYAAGGTYLAELNVTYNYRRIFADVLDMAGVPYRGMIRMLDGVTVADSLPVLELLTIVLPDEPTEDYWAAKPGNVGHAAALLLRMAKETDPEATWKADG